jgi:hypothetical protein
LQNYSPPPSIARHPKRQSTEQSSNHAKSAAITTTSLLAAGRSSLRQESDERLDLQSLPPPPPPPHSSADVTPFATPNLHLLAPQPQHPVQEDAPVFAIDMDFSIFAQDIPQLAQPPVDDGLPDEAIPPTPVILAAAAAAAKPAPEGKPSVIVPTRDLNSEV